MAMSSFASAISSCGTPSFSTERGHRLRGSRNILKTLPSVGANPACRVGLKKRLPSKWSEIGRWRRAPAPLALRRLPSSMSSIRKARQAGAIARELVARHVQLHRQKGVVAADAGHIHHALLAEALLGAGEGRVRDAFVLLQLRGEVVDDLLVGTHPGRPAAVGDGVRD